MEPHELAENVSDEKSFLTFVEALYKDRENAVRKEKETPSSPYGPDAGGWENTTIEDYLESSYAWAKDTDFGRKLDTPEHSRLKDVSPWQHFARFLMVGKYYE